MVAEKIAVRRVQVPGQGTGTLTVTWHDSCHIGRVSGVYEQPRQLIKALPNVKLVEMEHNSNEAHCCGSVVDLIKDPPIAAEIGKIRIGRGAGSRRRKDAGIVSLLRVPASCHGR